MSKLNFAKLVAIGYIVAIVTLGFIVPGVAGAAAPCNEDQPCWVWSKDGNKQRGVTVKGERHIVGPCTYAKLARAKRIDSTTAPLRGDWWARIICKPTS